MRTKDENSSSLIIAICKKCKFLEMKIFWQRFHKSSNSSRINEIIQRSCAYNNLLFLPSIKHIKSGKNNLRPIMTRDEKKAWIVIVL